MAKSAPKGPPEAPRFRDSNMAKKLAKVAQRTVVGGLLVVALWLIFDAAFESTTGFVVWSGAVIMTVGGVIELSRMDRILPKAQRIPLWLGLCASLTPGVLHYFGGDLGLGRELLDTSFLSFRGAAQSYLLGAVGMIVPVLLFARRGARPGMTLLLALWPFAALPALALVWSEYGPEGLLALVVLSKIGDIFGYYVGNAIGKGHPFPTISPGKTTAGCVASLVAGTLAGGACVWFELLPGGHDLLWAGFVAGAVINLAAQAGDLLESKLKRMAQVKDSGPWFGPSGGFLDLADSLLLSVPASLLSWPLLFS